MNYLTGEKELYWVINGETLKLEEAANSLSNAKSAAQELVVKRGHTMMITKVVAAYAVKAELVPVIP